MSCDRSMYCDNCGGGCSVDEGQQVPPPAPLDDFVRGYNEALSDVLLLIRKRDGAGTLRTIAFEIEAWKSRDV